MTLTDEQRDYIAGHHRDEHEKAISFVEWHRSHGAAHADMVTLFQMRADAHAACAEAFARGEAL